MRKHLLIAAVLMAFPMTVVHALENAPEQERYTRSPGKPAHPIQVRVVTSGTMKAGVESDARLLVTSSRPVETMEVIVKPAPKIAGIVMMEDRFMRRGGDMVKGRVELPLHFRPASDGPQPVEVLVRVTAPDGSTMSRTVALDLGQENAPAPDKRGQAVQVPDDYVEAGEDIVVKARQELKRGN